VDVRVVNEGDRHLAGLYALTLKDRAGRVLDTREIEWVVIRICNGNTDHDPIIGTWRIGLVDGFFASREKSVF
jgi:hypothetical protein